jgi:hypothetical protein
MHICQKVNTVTGKQGAYVACSASVITDTHSVPRLSGSRTFHVVRVHYTVYIFHYYTVTVYIFRYYTVIQYKYSAIILLYGIHIPLLYCYTVYIYSAIILLYGIHIPLLYFYTVNIFRYYTVKRYIPL